MIMTLMIYRLVKFHFGVDGTPKRGWTTLPQSAQEAIEYVYRGLEAMGENKTTGTAWKEADAGINTEG